MEQPKNNIEWRESFYRLESYGVTPEVTVRLVKIIEQLLSSQKSELKERLEGISFELGNINTEMRFTTKLVVLEDVIKLFNE